MTDLHMVDRLEKDTNMVMRFIIGSTHDAAKEAEVLAESRQYGGFMRLAMEVSHLPNASQSAASKCPISQLTSCAPISSDLLVVPLAILVVRPCG